MLCSYVTSDLMKIQDASCYMQNCVSEKRHCHLAPFSPSTIVTWRHCHLAPLSPGANTGRPQGGYLCMQCWRQPFQVGWEQVCITHNNVNIKTTSLHRSELGDMQIYTNSQLSNSQSFLRDHTFFSLSRLLTVSDIRALRRVSVRGCSLAQLFTIVDGVDSRHLAYLLSCVHTRPSRKNFANHLYLSNVSGWSSSATGSDHKWAPAVT